MTNARLAMYLTAGIIAYAVIAWLIYVARYRQSQIETLARLVLTGADRARNRLLVEEGLLDA